MSAVAAGAPPTAYAGKPCVCQHRREHCDESCARDLQSAPMYMAALRLRGRRCLVVGGSQLAHEKTLGLIGAGARVTLVATDAVPALVELAHAGAIDWAQRDYDSADLAGCVLVVAATDERELNIAIFEQAEARAMLVNVVDVPSLCNFILPAVARQGPLAIAISTSGASPMLAARMKREIAEQFGEPYAQLATLLAEVRGWAKMTLPTYTDRKAFFSAIIDGEPDPIELLRAGDLAAVQRLITDTQRSFADALASREVGE